MTKSDLSIWRYDFQPTNQQNNANFQRLLYWSGDWVAGAYEPQEAVRYLGTSWVCLIATTATPAASSPDWELLVVPEQDIYNGTLLAITGTTPVPLVFDPINLDPSSFFTVVGGNLQTLVAGLYTCEASFVWTPTVANNEDAGLVLDVALRSGTGSIAIDDPFGSIFQSSRANSQAFGSSHSFGVANLAVGDVIGLDASDYTGQTGVTDLDSLHLYIKLLSPT